MKSQVTDTLTQRIKKAAEEANNTFWETVAEQFPEIKSGNFPAPCAYKMEVQAEEWIKLWVDLNQIMETLSSRLNFSQEDLHSNAVKIEKNKDINFYETLCLYCADNSIDLTEISESDFSSASMILENYGRDDLSEDYFYFWID